MAQKIIDDKRKQKILDELQKTKEKDLASAYIKARDSIKKELAALEQKGLLTNEDAQRYGRLTDLKKKVETELQKTIKLTNTTLTEAQKELYVKSYEMTGAAIEETLGKSLSLTLIPKAQVARSIVNTMDKVGFIKRNSKNTIGIIKDLNQIITQGIIQGKGYAKIAKQVDEKFNQGYNNSIRIVRTEGHRVREQGTFDSMNNAQNKGVRMKKQWLSAKDNRTRDDHLELDGQTIEMDEEFEVSGNSTDKPGNFGVPEEDINCRCRLITVVEY